MARSVGRLRVEATELRRTGFRGRRGYPEAFRARARREVARRRADGVTWRVIAEDLGLPLHTLQRWQRGQESATAFRPVSVRLDPAEPQETKAVTIVTPHGY